MKCLFKETTKLELKTGDVIEVMNGINEVQHMLVAERGAKYHGVCLEKNFITQGFNSLEELYSFCDTIGWSALRIIKSENICVTEE